MARIKRHQVHVSIDPEAFEVIDAYHWKERVDISKILRGVIEDFASEIAPSVNSDYASCAQSDDE